MADLKKIYTAVTQEEAGTNLEAFAEKWRKQYPSCVKSREENWEILSTFFEYPMEIRKIVYATNIIEGLDRQFRQIAKNKPSFTNDDPPRRILYLASQRIVKHWHAGCQNWDLVLSQLQLMFADPLGAVFPGVLRGHSRRKRRAFPHSAPGNWATKRNKPNCAYLLCKFFTLSKISYT